MTSVWTDRALARAVGGAAVKSGIMKVDLDQFSPGNESVNGREETAVLIKTSHRGGPANLVKEHYRAADAQRIAKDGATDREATVNAERYLANHLSLSDPRGDILRKADSHSTALDAIRKALSCSPRRLSKATGLPPEDDNGTWTDPDPGRAGAVSPHDDPSAGFTGTPPNPTLGSPPHSASIRVGRPPPTEEDATVKAIKEVHKAGPRPLWG